jgi:hypothetical protein
MSFAALAIIIIIITPKVGKNMQILNVLPLQIRSSKPP